MQAISKDSMENYENVEQYSDEYCDQIIADHDSESNQSLSQEEQLTGLSVLQKYMSNNHQIFIPESLNLDDLVLLKNRVIIPFIESEFQELKRTIKSYFSEERNKTSMDCRRRKARKEISSEYLLNLSELPYYETYFLSITEIGENRFNMLVKNHRGEIISFFAKQRKVKKISKILKLFCGMKKPAFAVVIDRTTQDSMHVDNVAKLSDFITEFVYLYEDVPNDVIKMYENRKKENELHGLKYNYMLEGNGSELIISSSRIGSVFKDEIYDTVIGRLRRQDEEENEVLKSIRGEFESKDRNLYFDFMFLNFWRALNWSPEQCLAYVLEMLDKKEEKIIEKELLDNNRTEMYGEEDNNDPNCHYPTTMQESKLCKRCETVRKRRFKKTKYRCIGCSVTFKEDVALCPDCFSDFHARIDVFGPRMLSKKKNCNGVTPIKRIRYKKRSNHNPSEDLKQTENKLCELAKEEPNELKIEPFDHIKHEVFDIHEKFEEPEEEEINLEVQQKVIKLDEKITETFNIVKQLGEKGHYGVSGVFLGILLNSTLKRMKFISTNFPSMNTGLTKIGSDVYDLAKSNEENGTGTRGSKVSNIVELLLKAEKLKAEMNEESSNLLKEKE